MMRGEMHPHFQHSHQLRRLHSRTRFKYCNGDRFLNTGAATLEWRPVGNVELCLLSVNRMFKCADLDLFGSQVSDCTL